ncbi:hypothetical protein BEUL_1457 [Bifidobacterium eulemuris]|uniref:Uncharacterized protein n=1 Tax=Bifidobacterium eulemuris TaxID=1765219 RepID=A0A261G8N5_9BIFI|nr:hypothetical protein BEUL_1457 [Bifidobacterium eulemuris]
MMHRESGSYFHFLLGGWLTGRRNAFLRLNSFLINQAKALRRRWMLMGLGVPSSCAHRET